MYDTENYIYLHVSHDEDVGKCITLLKYENKKAEYLTDYIPIERNKAVKLKMVINKGNVSCYYSIGDIDNMIQIGPVIDAGFLSDEACNQGWFTGAMIGICAQDLTGDGIYADFDYFELK